MLNGRWRPHSACFVCLLCPALRSALGRDGPGRSYFTDRRRPLRPGPLPQLFWSLVKRVCSEHPAPLGHRLLFLHYAQVVADDARERLKVALCEGIRGPGGVKVADLQQFLSEALVVRLFAFRAPWAAEMVQRAFFWACGGPICALLLLRHSAVTPLSS